MFGGRGAQRDPGMTIQFILGPERASGRALPFSSGPGPAGCRGPGSTDVVKGVTNKVEDGIFYAIGPMAWRIQSFGLILGPPSTSVCCSQNQHFCPCPTLSL